MTTKTKAATPQQAHELVAKDGATPDRDIRYVRELDIGQHTRQGDCYLLRVASKPECYFAATINRQLAPGTSKGSRHIVDGKLACFTADERSARDAIARLPGVRGGRTLLPGPCIVADERFTLTHPEHAHHSLPAGCYLVLYQLDPRSMRRVED